MHVDALCAQRAMRNQGRPMPGPAASHPAPAQPAFGAASRAALRHLKQTRPARTAPPPALDAQAADSEASNAAAMLETPQLKALEVQPASPPRQPGPRHSRSLSVSAARETLSAHICHASVQCHSHAPPSTMVMLAKHPRRVVAYARRSPCIHMQHRCTCQQRPLHKACVQRLRSLPLHGKWPRTVRLKERA